MIDVYFILFASDDFAPVRWPTATMLLDYNITGITCVISTRFPLLSNFSMLL